MKNVTQLPWQQMAILLANKTQMSWREIAKELGIAKSTCSDLLRKQLS